MCLCVCVLVCVYLCVHVYMSQIRYFPEWVAATHAVSSFVQFSAFWSFRKDRGGNGLEVSSVSLDVTGDWPVLNIPNKWSKVSLLCVQ